ncbi:MAG: hypothetical protein OXE02_13740 [Chloroflexi bacterium]|nr:hypothetical protein [Chloroflexota bacterium]
MEHESVETDRESVEGHARRYVEDAHGLRLMALLEGLVREHDVKWAAEQLGVDVRTVTTCLRRRRLTDHVRVALEGRLQAETDRLAQEVGELAARLAALTPEMEGLRSSVAQEVGALREEQAGVVRGLERRLARVEVQHEGGAGADGGSKVTPTARASEPQRESPRRQVYRQARPKVVTAEPEHGEEEVYGDAGPLVIAWRQARAADRTARGMLERAEATERLMSLEIALMEGHGLTLAPERDPFDGLKMYGELKWRRLALSNARRERRRAVRRRWLRRALTLGFWWE